MLAVQAENGEGAPIEPAQGGDSFGQANFTEVEGGLLPIDDQGLDEPLPAAASHTDRVMKVMHYRAKPARVPTPPRDIEPQVTQLEGIKAVWFDMFGTLIHHQGNIFQVDQGRSGDALVEALKDFRAVMHKYSCYFASLDVSGRMRAALEKARAADGPSAEITLVDVMEGVLAQMRKDRAFYGERPDITPTLMAVAYELHATEIGPYAWGGSSWGQVMGALQEAGIPLGLLSNAQPYSHLFLPACHEDWTGNGWFAEGWTVLSGVVGHKKPGEAIFGEAERRLEEVGLEPRQVLYVGNDLLNDIHASQARGFRTALFAGDHLSLKLRPGTDAQGCRPDIVITSPDQLLHALGLPPIRTPYWGEDC